MSHKPYNLYKRPTKKPGKYIYYVQFYDETGNRLSAKSTNQVSKSAAETWAIEQIKRGLITSPKNITFGQYAQDWWIWDKCQYIKGRLARGANLSRSYADSMRTYLTQHILPYFENKKLQKITSKMIEEWLMTLREKSGKTGVPLSHTTVNHCLTCLKIILKEAVRLEYLYRSPATGIKQLLEKPKEKSILTIGEVKELFFEDNIDHIWSGDLRHFTLNLLAASTGMRMGEVQALMCQYVHKNYIEVFYTWDRKYGLKKGAKWSSERQIPIPFKTYIYLQELISISPFKEPTDLVFFGKTKNKPIYNKTISDRLYKAFENIGISQEEQKRRNITFHSWRYFYNSLMRGKIHDSKLRRLTGHKTLEMTEHYTHFKIEDFQDVVKIQEDFFGSKSN